MENGQRDIVHWEVGQLQSSLLAAPIVLGREPKCRQTGTYDEQKVTIVSYGTFTLTEGQDQKTSAPDNSAHQQFCLWDHKREHQNLLRFE